jgi:hypothetical protein
MFQIIHDKSNYYRLEISSYYVILIITNTVSSCFR